MARSAAARVAAGVGKVAANARIQPRVVESMGNFRAGDGRPLLLEKPTKLVVRKACVANDRSHRDRIHGIVARDRYDPDAIGHHDVLSLPHNVKAGILQSANGVEVMNAGKLGHD